jgi:actin related protein 2/3 complex, subunit 1A/1B
VAFGEVYAEFGCSGWVHSVAWSPSGSSLAFSGHDSSVHVVTFPRVGAAPVESVVLMQTLPVTVLSFISERAIIGGGHDFNPAIFTGNLTALRTRPCPPNHSGSDHHHHHPSSSS